jgi:hypothetical protein
MATVEETEATMPPPPGGGRSEGSASRRNAIRDGCRSLSQFPEDMQRVINAREDALRDELKPENELEVICVEEIACASIQVRVCEGQVEQDKVRFRTESGLTWDDDRRTEVYALAERLPKAPQRVAHLLEQSLQGAEFCIERWVGLRDSVEANGRLTEPQRQRAFDLLGVDLLARDGTKRVPAADDAAGLLALVERQEKRLKDRINGELRSRDERARERAKRGLPTVQDAETKRVRSNFSRASRRLKWATEMFWQLRQDLALGVPLDPELLEAILKKGRENKARKKPPAAAPAASAAPPDPEAVEADDPEPKADPRDDVPIVLPPDVPAEYRDMIKTAAAALRSKLLAMPLTSHPSDPFPGEKVVPAHRK